MLAVGSLAQAWEIFFAIYIYSNYLYRPFFADPPGVRSVALLKPLAEQLYELVENFAFSKLRNTFIRTILRAWHPATLTAAASSIATLASSKLWNHLDPAELESHPNATERELFTAVLSLETDKLRNRVVHKEAYRPTLAEFNHCRE